MTENRTPAADDLEQDVNQTIMIRALPTHEIQLNLLTEYRPLPTDDLTEERARQFLSLGFTHHYEILAKTQSLEERLFYIERCASEFWSKETLRYHLKSNLYTKQGNLPNNFQTTISDQDFRRKALLSFKDEYLLDYINIESPDDEPDERVLESEIDECRHLQNRHRTPPRIQKHPPRHRKPERTAVTPTHTQKFQTKNLEKLKNICTFVTEFKKQLRVRSSEVRTTDRRN